MFLHINLCQMLILKINSICFFLQKSETKSYCRLLHLFELNQVKPNSVVGLQSLINILWTHRLFQPCGKCTGRPGPSDVGLIRPLLICGLHKSFMAKCTGQPGPSDIGLYRPLLICGLLQRFVANVQADQAHQMLASIGLW